MKRALFTILFAAIFVARAWAGDEAPTVESNKNLIDVVQSHADYVWTLVAAALVFFMQAGFAMVETGFTRAKNAVNIMMKNLMDFSMGSLAFWAIGFGIMFGAHQQGGLGPQVSFYLILKSAVILGCWRFGCSRLSFAPPPRPSFPVPWLKGPNFPVT